MSEHEEIIEALADAEVRRNACASMAWRAAEAGHFETSDLYDEWCDTASDEIGRLKDRLHEIEAAVSRREFLADSAYGRML